MPKILMGFVGVLALASIASNYATACDPHALEINVDWLKDNNKPDTQKMQTACNNLLATNSADAMQRIIDAFHDGQGHNPSAAGTIDGCNIFDIRQHVCGRYV